MRIISITDVIKLVNVRSLSRWVARGLIGILVITTFFSDNVEADPGDLDTSFSFDGLVTTRFGPGTDEETFALAIQTDGKIFVNLTPFLRLVSLRPPSNSGPDIDSPDTMAAENT